MTDLHVPWLEMAILTPLVGAVVVSFFRDVVVARRWCFAFTVAACILTVGEYLDFTLLRAHSQIQQADDPGHVLRNLFGRELIVVDQISAPLLVLSALLFALTTAATVRTKTHRFSFATTLFAEAIGLAIFCCKEPWILIGLLALGVLPPLLVLRARKRPTSVYLLHLGVYVVLLAGGWAMVEWENAHAGDGPHVHSLWAIVPLLIAVFIRVGIVPFHCWVTDFFEHATFGTAILFVTPLTGVYAATRLLLPIAPDSVLRVMGVLALVTAVYAAGMALVQREGRRFFCYLFLSHSALVLVGLEMVTPLGVTGALCLWLSVGLSLGGLGLTLRALEARRGRLALNNFQGLYEHAPMLAICFILTGLASVGFPGTLGFIGTELLVDGAVEVYYPLVGAAVVIASALNGIAIVKAYFLLFTGTRYSSGIWLGASRSERFAVLTLAALLLLGGLLPQFNVAARFEAAETLIQERHRNHLDAPQAIEE
jgi:NADH-quinone oxidoreductase subunit M